MRRLSLICLLVACVAACNLAPRDSYEAGAPWPDAGGDLTGDASGPSVTVLWDRPFGLEGERLVELTAGKAGRYLAVTDSAIYLLDDAARQISRSPHPTGAGGARAKIQAALDEHMACCTTVIIAQRISSVLTADQIIVLDHGQIAARGTHRELLDSSPIYQDAHA